MRPTLLLPVGVLIALGGVLFTLQGLDVLGGSAMSGKTLWAVLGPVIVLVGVGLAIAGLQANRRSRR